ELGDGVQHSAVGFESIRVRIGIKRRLLLRRKKTKIKIDIRCRSPLIADEILGFIKGFKDVQHCPGIFICNFALENDAVIDWVKSCLFIISNAFGGGIAKKSAHISAVTQVHAASIDEIHLI